MRNKVLFLSPRTLYLELLPAIILLGKAGKLDWSAEENRENSSLRLCWNEYSGDLVLHFHKLTSDGLKKDMDKIDAAVPMSWLLVHMGRAPKMQDPKLAIK